MRRHIAVTACLGFLLYFSASAQQSMPDRVRSWIYKKLRIDPQIAQKLTAPRGAGVRRIGQSVMSVQVATEEESQIWSCGRCWAPALAGAQDIAVLKADGIWLIQGVTAPRLAVRADGLLDILGQTADHSNQLLVVQKASAHHGGCSSALMLADLSAGSLQKAIIPGVRCIDGLTNLLHRDELLAGRRLGSSERNGSVGPALRLLVQQITPSGGSAFEPLTPKLNAKDSTIDRFDPIWRTPQEVIFLSDAK